MKQFLMILLIFGVSLEAFALEDYIITSCEKVENIFVRNKNIVEVIPTFTIDNDKKILFLKAKNEGETVVIIDTVDGEKIINVKVFETKTDLSPVEGFKYFIFDKPEGSLWNK